MHELSSGGCEMRHATRRVTPGRIKSRQVSRRLDFRDTVQFPRIVIYQSLLVCFAYPRDNLCLQGGYIPVRSEMKATRTYENHLSDSG